MVTFVKDCPDCLAQDQTQYKLTTEMFSDSHGSMNGLFKHGLLFPKGYPESQLFNNVYTHMSADLGLSLAIPTVCWQCWMSTTIWRCGQGQTNRKSERWCSQTRPLGIRKLAIANQSLPVFIVKTSLQSQDSPPMEHNTFREGENREETRTPLCRTISHPRDITIIAWLGLFVTSYACGRDLLSCVLPDRGKRAMSMSPAILCDTVRFRYQLTTAVITVVVTSS